MKRENSSNERKRNSTRPRWETLWEQTPNGVETDKRGEKIIYNWGNLQELKEKGTKKMTNEENEEKQVNEELEEEIRKGGMHTWISRLPKENSSLKRTS